MKRILLCSLAVASVFGTGAASAITSAEVKSFAGSVSSFNTDPYYIAMGLPNVASLRQPYEVVANTPSAQMDTWMGTVNSTLSSAGCAGVGTSSYPNHNANTLSSCLSAVSSALASQGSTAQLAGALAVHKVIGAPYTIPGSVVSVNSKDVQPPPPPPSQTKPPTFLPQILRATSLQQANTISNVAGNASSPRALKTPGAPIRVSLGNEKGMAAGDAPSKLNAWVNASDTTIGSSASASTFDGNVTNAIGGIDYRFSDKLVAGVSVGYDRVSLDFKSAVLANSGLSSNGWMVAPYASYQINDIFSVDGSCGYADGDVDKKMSGVITPNGYTRNFLALNLNANYWVGDWQLTGKANYIQAEEKEATTSRMETIRLGGQIGYWIGGIMPYASLTYVRDLKVSNGVISGGTPFTSPDDDAWIASVGANLFSKGALSGGISYTQEFDRADSKNHTFMANIGYRF